MDDLMTRQHGVSPKIQQDRDRRERIATAVLGHLLVVKVPNPPTGSSLFSTPARAAVAFADALIAELDK